MEWGRTGLSTDCEGNAFYIFMITEIWFSPSRLSWNITTSRKPSPPPQVGLCAPLLWAPTVPAVPDLLAPCPWDSQPPELFEIKTCYFKAPGLWCFVTAAELTKTSPRHSALPVSISSPPYSCTQSDFTPSPFQGHCSGQGQRPASSCQSPSFSHSTPLTTQQSEPRYFIAVRLAKIKKSDNIKCWQRWEAQECLCTASGRERINPLWRAV